MGDRKRIMIRAVLFCTVAWVGVGMGLEVNGAPPAGEQGSIFDDDADDKSAGKHAVKVGSFGQVDLHVKDLEVAKVLQLLSLQSQRNIIASRNVAGMISADLYGVDFYEALDAILHTNGFGYQEKGNLIFVYTGSELEAIEDAQRKPVTRIVRLNYITAADASAFATPLLSEAGSLSISGDVGAGFQPSLSDGGANSFAHSDTIVIRDFQENIEEILEVIKDLDRRPKQVLVESTILQARLTEDNAFGVDLSVLADFALSNFSDPLGVVNDVISGTTSLPKGRGAFQTSVGNTSAGQSGAKIGIVTHSVSAFIRALDAVTDTTVLANPKLLVLNRQRADLLVGEKLGYLSSTATQTSTTQTVEFLEIGTQLTLRPFVSEDGFIRLELKPSISAGDTTRTVGSFVVPETTNQEITTNVVVRSGQTVVLGGLFKEDTTVTRKQVPLLGDIPLLGVMFKSQDDKVVRNEVIFLITPTIIKDESLYALGESTQESIEMARLGAREGLLPWSRTKMTAAYLRDAQRYYSEGNSEKALWAVNMALTLEPKSYEAIEFKQKITGKQVYDPVNFSILNGTVDDILRGAVGNGAGSQGYSWPESSDVPMDSSSFNTTIPSMVTPAVDTGFDQPAWQDNSSYQIQDMDSQNFDSGLSTQPDPVFEDSFEAQSEPAFDMEIPAQDNSTWDDFAPTDDTQFETEVMPEPQAKIEPQPSTSVKPQAEAKSQIQSWLKKSLTSKKRETPKADVASIIPVTPKAQVPSASVEVPSITDDAPMLMTNQPVVATPTVTAPTVATSTVTTPDTLQAQTVEVPQWDDSAAFTPAIDPGMDVDTTADVSAFQANDSVEDSLSRTAADFGFVRDEVAQQATAPDLSAGVIAVEDQFQADELITTESEDVPESDPFNAVVEWLLLSPDQED